MKSQRSSALTSAQVREALNYDALTGVFTWKRSHGRAKGGSVAGSLGEKGYIDITLRGERHGAHRLAWFVTHEVWPVEIDHENGVKNDNRINNLRDVAHLVNTQNLKRAHCRNTSSGMLGVRRSDTKSVRFNAIIMAGGKVKCLGSFGTPDEAHAAYVDAKRDLHEGCTL
jgi:hypothetical protein